MTLRLTLALVLVAAVAISRGVGADEDPGPRLLLLLTVDQARGDYLERFGPALRGGLRKLRDEGVLFANAHHFHATTVTAAGHTSLATGLFPSHSGVVGNSWYDRIEGRVVYSMEDREAPLLPPTSPRSRTRSATASASRGRSPSRILGTALADWIQRAHPETKVWSVGAKDRSAIPMGGKGAHGVYWYEQGTGHWITSRYYAREYPRWVREFHASRPADAYFGTKWEPLDVADGELEAMGVVTSGDGADGRGFPVTLGGASLYPSSSFYHALFESPFIESYLLDFAERVVVEEGLGSDETIDVLALSFSAVDAVGHAYGPNSRELLDTVMRLDRELGRFFTFLDKRVGLERVAVALSADHGVATLPEYRGKDGEPAGRLDTDDFTCFQQAGKRFERAFGRDRWFVGSRHFDYETLGRRNVKRETAEAFFAKELASCPNVARVWTRSEIERAAASEAWVDPKLALYLHGFHPDRSPDLFVELERGFIGRRHGTTHGSRHDYDTWVIAAVLWPGLEPGSISERIHTVDIPVTLASLLGVEMPEGLDGTDRSHLMR